MKIILKSIILVLISLFYVSDLKSQDLIFLKDYSDTIFCRIVKDNIKNIEYRLTSKNDTALYVISSNDIEGYVLSQNNFNTLKSEKVTYTARDSVFMKNQNNSKKTKNYSRIYIIIISSVLAVIASSLSMMPK